MTDQQPPQSWGPQPQAAGPWAGTPAPPAAPPPAPRSGVPAWTLPIVACLCLAVGAVLGGAVVGSGDDDGEVVSEAPATTEDEPDPTDPPDEPPASDPADPEPPATEGPTTTGEPQSTDTPSFGETYEWGDGLAISVAAPTPYTRTETAIGGEDAAADLQFEVTVTNGSDAPFDPTSIYITVQSGSAEAEQIFDSAGGLVGAPSTSVLAGREVVFTVGFGVSDPDDLVMEIAPDFDHDATFFTS